MENYLPILISTLEYLVFMRNLKSLNLSRNHLKNEFVQRLVPILLKTQSLEHLDLSSNNLSDDGFLSLCQYLEGNQTLTSLNLNYNRFIGDDAASKLALAL